VPPTTGVVEAVDRETCVLTTGADALVTIAVHLAALGHDFVVLEPPGMVRELGRLADRLGAAYRESRERSRTG
jgi:hypothetical protein